MKNKVKVKKKMSGRNYNRKRENGIISTTFVNIQINEYKRVINDKKKKKIVKK